MKYLFVFILLVSGNLVAQDSQSSEQQEISQKMQDALDQLNYNLDTLDIQALLKESITQAHNQLKEIDINQLQEILKSSIDLVEKLDLDELENMMEDMPIKDQLEKLFQDLDLERIEEALPQTREKAPRKI